MQYTTLGNTGLRVSVAGLGTGGFSRLGLRAGKTEDEAARLIHEAVGLGINQVHQEVNGSWKTARRGCGITFGGTP